MKLLLDEMWPPEIASQLRARGHDVVAVAERPELRASSDEHIFELAQRERRCIVTENSRDVRLIAAAQAGRSRDHAGLIFTSHRRFPRRDERFIGQLVVAVERLLRSGADVTAREVWLR